MKIISLAVQGMTMRLSKAEEIRREKEKRAEAIE
jgi:hypothetical protein